MVVSIGWFPIFTWEMVGNHQTSIYKWLFGVPGVYHRKHASFITASHNNEAFLVEFFIRNPSILKIDPIESRFFSCFGDLYFSRELFPWKFHLPIPPSQLQVGMVKSDLCRLVMLYNIGGLYFDTDCHFFFLHSYDRYLPCWRDDMTVCFKN